MPIRASIKKERPHEQVYWSEITGWPSAASARLRRTISAISRRGAYHRKIGITNDPERRWSQAYRRHGWENMRVLYKTARHAHVCELERELIEFLGLDSSAGYYWNATGGGGGRKPVVGPFYVYLVTAPKYARIT